MAIKHEAIMGRGDVYRLNPDLIVVKEGRNPRQVFGDAEDATFVDFIVTNGAAFPPITVRKVNTPEEDYFELVEGERRLRCTGEAGRAVGRVFPIPAMIADRKLEEADYITANLTRNAGKPLTRMEEARAYKRLNEEFGLSHAKIGKMVGRSDTHIGRRIKLLALSDSDQKAVDEKQILLGDAEQKADEQREEQTPEIEKPKKAKVQPMMKRRTVGASLKAILTGEYEMPSDQALFQGVATGMVMVLFNMDIDDAKVKVVELQGVFKDAQRKED